MSKQSPAWVISHQALQRRGLAADLAGTFVYLVSEDSAFRNGQVISADGGWILR